MLYVDKQWGHEEIIVNDKGGDYCLKRLVVDPNGYRCSRHFHERKHETFVVEKGRLHVLTEVEGNKTFSTYRPGEKVTILPGVVHAFWSHVPTSFLEVSKYDEAEDSIRVDQSQEMTDEERKNWLAWPGSANFLVVGDVMLDRYEWYRFMKMSPEAPVPVLHYEESSEMPGGAANVAKCLKDLGAKVDLLGVIGDDAEGRQLMSLFDGDGASCLFSIDRHRPTTVKTRQMIGHHQTHRLDREVTKPIAPEALSNLMHMLHNTKFRYYDAVIISDYGKGIINNDLYVNVCSLAYSAGIPVLIDPYVPHFANGVYECRKEIKPSVMKLNKSEAMSCNATLGRDFVLNVESLCEASEIDTVVVTKGDDGAVVHDAKRHESFEVSPHRQGRPVDVSGAGDVFISHMAVEMRTSQLNKELLQLCVNESTDYVLNGRDY